MNSPIIKRSIILHAHKTSVSLEQPFWLELKSIAAERRVPLHRLIAEVDEKRGHGNLYSALRLFVLAKYRPEAAGKLMNLRIGQAIVHDEWLTEAPFDPEAHTDRVIAALDTYKKHGILAINVSLQGANPEYGLSGVVKRDRHYKMGPGKGMHTSAFRPDGTLKPEWMKRALRSTTSHPSW